MKGELRNRRRGIGRKCAQMRLKAGHTIGLISREVVDCAERFIAHGLDCLLERKHAGREASPLIRRAVLVHPIPHQPLFFRVGGMEFDDGLLRALPASAEVGMESPECLQWNISRDAAVALRVEREPAALGGDDAVPHGRRRVHERALGRVAEKRFGDLSPPALRDVQPCRLICDALRVLGGLELVIASGVLQQRLDGRRSVVHR